MEAFLRLETVHAHAVVGDSSPLHAGFLLLLWHEAANPIFIEQLKIPSSCIYSLEFSIIVLFEVLLASQYCLSIFAMVDLKHFIWILHFNLVQVEIMTTTYKQNE